jgi:26S proteasome regulatory subunit (ATPase 3-interacting protein)
MKTQNRPYSLINIFDNLHGAVKKSQLIKILDSLVDEGFLIMKEYNTKIYLFNQDKLDIKVSEADIDKVQKEIDEKREENKALKDEISSKLNELKLLTSTYTDEELKNRIKELKKELSKIKVKVDDIKANKIDPVPPEKMAEAKEYFEKELKVFKKTKKICLDIVSDISDGLELKLSETFEKIGIETDDDLIKQLGIDQNLINGK